MVPYFGRYPSWLFVNKAPFKMTVMKDTNVWLVNGIKDHWCYLRILRNSKSALLKVCSHYFQTGSESNRVSYRSPKAWFTYQVQYRKHIQTLLRVIVLKRLKTWTSLTSELWHTHDIHMLTPPRPQTFWFGQHVRSNGDTNLSLIHKHSDLPSLQTGNFLALCPQWPTLYEITALSCFCPSPPRWFLLASQQRNKNLNKFLNSRCHVWYPLKLQ